jgi:hypothetical protein
MAGTLIPSNRRKFFVEDTRGGASVSESIGSKLGSSMNFIFDRIVQHIEFGADGAVLSSLNMPFVFDDYTDFALENLLIQRIRVSLGTSGTSGQTEFRLEKRLAAGSTFNTIFSTNCIISNTAADNLVFSSDGSAPSGVTLPVLSDTGLAIGDELRFVLITAATVAQNLTIRVEVSPI